MALADLTSRANVEAAMDEYDRLGREAFLAKYKSGGRYSYFVFRAGKPYESKPIAAAAHRFQFGTPLDPKSFSGGARTVVRKLTELGFEVDGPRERVASAVELEEISDLERGGAYSWTQLGALFEFKPAYLSIAGGMISRPDDNVVLLITHPGGARSFDYGDYWDQDDLIYTGRGQHGDQQRAGANRDVGENLASLLVFEAADASRELVFLGQAVCADEWTAIAPDREKRLRRVLRFRLTFATERVNPEPAGRRGSPAGRRGLRSGSLVVAKQPRPFDPSRVPTAAQPKGWRRSPEEILALQEQARRGHHILLTQLAAWLEHHAWHDIQEIEGAVDLWATRADDGRRVLFEVKTLGVRSEITRVRAALAQLLEYRYFYGEDTDQLCIVTDGPLSDRRCRLLDSLDVGVLWRDGESFKAGSRVAAELLRGSALA